MNELADLAAPVDCDVAIVGSGFGATVAATAIAGKFPDRDIRVIERGAYFRSAEAAPPHAPGSQTFAEPDNVAGLLAFGKLLDVHLRGRALGSRLEPLYHYSAFDDVHVVTASGVGGGSLIYSNVSLPPFKDSSGKYPVIDHWPMRLADADFAAAANWMRRWRGATSRIVTSVPLSPRLASHVNDLSQVPNSGGAYDNYEYLYLGRSDALRRGSRKMTLPGGVTMTESWRPVPLEVLEHVEDQTGDYAERRFCERQGRCILGCTPGAMNSLDRSLAVLLTQYSNVRVEARTRAETIAKDGRRYVINCGKRSFRAPVVVLSAGSMGSTEILLKSGKHLPLSYNIGHRFSSNGDFSGFIDSIPHDFLGKWVMPTKGPINSCSTRFRTGPFWMTIEDAGVPRMFARLVRFVLDLQRSASPLAAIVRDDLIEALQNFDAARVVSILTQPIFGDLSDDEVLKDVFWFNCMGNETHPGQMSLSGGKLKIKYARGQQPEDDPLYPAIESILKAFAAGMGGRYVSFPMWGGPFGKVQMVTHPLGGCALGRSSTEGVVDLNGEVFDTPSGGSSVHPGLFVMDGAVLPGPVGANPTLTIVAVALRMTARLVAAVGELTRRH